MPIKIIKPGKLKNPKDTRRFLCLNCGCIFETRPNCHRLCCTDGDER